MKIKTFWKKNFGQDRRLTLVAGGLVVSALLFTLALNLKNGGWSPNLKTEFEKNFTLPEFYELARRGTPEEVYSLLKEKFSSNPVAAHDYTHAVGEVVYEDRGEEGITLCDPFSNYGCFHGFLAAFIVKRGEKALPETETSCKKLSPIDIPSCLHGIGHGVLAWRNYELGSALAACDALTQPSQIYCYDGVFMESFTGSMLPQEKRVARQLDSSDPWLPCTGLQEKYLTACYRQKVFDLFGFLGGDFKKLAALCSDLPEKYKPVCVESYGYRVAISVQTNLEEADKLCGLLGQGAKRDECLLSAMAELSFEGRPASSLEKICELVGSGRAAECREKLRTLQEIHQARFGR